jgi:hypothetical protein
MRLHAALAAAATLVALAFCLATLERWTARRRQHELAWTLALGFFALGSGALWLGAAHGWGEWSFRVFYLCGAIANVPLLAVGTVYLLRGERAGRAAFVGAVLFATFAAGWVLAAPLEGAIPTDELPRGGAVFGPGPRVLAAAGSGVGATVLLLGAVWSAVSLLVGRRRPPVTRSGAPSARRLAAANGLIAAGTLVLSAGGLLNSTLGEMDAFSVSLVAGVSLIFAGFLTTNAAPAPTAAAPWLQDLLEEPLDTHREDVRRVPDRGAAEEHRAAEEYAGLQGPREN